MQRVVHTAVSRLNQKQQPATALALMVEKATSRPRGGSRPARNDRFAGLIPIPHGDFSGELLEALTERAHLITRTSRARALEAIRSGSAWTARLGPPPTDPARREAWIRRAATISLYREKHSVTSALPLGDAAAITDRPQAHDYRAARDAYQRTLRLRGTNEPAAPAPQRSNPARRYGPRL